jgi:S-formylglutathione hydrolase FrmB
MKRTVAFYLLLVGLAAVLPAGTIDTVQVTSQAMGRTLPAIVVLPDRYFETTEYFPVVYLLHGYTGDYTNWAAKIDLPSLADRYRCLIVCPEGGKDSWYLDSPVEPRSRYRTFVGEELRDEIDRRYRTYAFREGRAITGLSMGGHGALYLAYYYPENYCAAGTMSGVLDLRTTRLQGRILELLGFPPAATDSLQRYSAVHFVRRWNPPVPALLIDCGVEDRFLESNREVHARLLERGIPHDYVERPGGHSWEYWTNALEYHLLFFRKMFDRAGKAGSDKGSG